MEPLTSINKIYSTLIQEESNNVALLPKPDNNINIEESNTLNNAYDTRKSQDRGRNPTSGGYDGYKKDTRLCSHCNRPKTP